MNFDWSEYLELAQIMMEKADEFSDQESVYRSVVSRAYYAVFCMTRNYVRDVDNTQFYGNDHQSLQNYLKRHSHKIRRKIGNQLQDLHQHRIKADYHDNLGELPINKATRAVAQARKIMEGLAQLS